MSQNESLPPSGWNAVLHVRHVVVVAEERPDPEGGESRVSPPTDCAVQQPLDEQLVGQPAPTGADAQRRRWRRSRGARRGRPVSSGQLEGLGEQHGEADERRRRQHGVDRAPWSPSSSDAAPADAADEQPPEVGAASAGDDHQRADRRVDQHDAVADARRGRARSPPRSSGPCRSSHPAGEQAEAEDHQAEGDRERELAGHRRLAGCRRRC